MKRYKKIYISSIILIAVVITSVYFSYAFFANKNEQHGKLNVVVGDLEYELTSSDLTNNSITVAAGETKTIIISLNNLNNISGKYELYYNLSNNNNVEVGYTNNPSSGIINNNEIINIDVVIKNNGSEETVVTFGCAKGLINNELVMTEGSSLARIELEEEIPCEYVIGQVWEFNYTGGEQSLPITGCSGNYKLEVWGAQGGQAYSSTYNGGYGGYSFGEILLSTNEVLYVNVGGKGANGVNTKGTVLNGGYNGGGIGRNFANADGRYIASGGGATHIALTSGLLSSLSDSIDNILIVAGGGGGAGYISDNMNNKGGNGGGFKGVSVTGWDSDGTTAVTANGGAQNASTQTNVRKGSFGVGGGNQTNRPGAGGGFYGGNSTNYAAAGGSGYIANERLTNKGMYCVSCTASSTASTKTTKTSNKSSTATANYGKTGNGYAKITYVSPITNETTISEGKNIYMTTTGKKTYYQKISANEYDNIIFGRNSDGYTVMLKDDYISIKWDISKLMKVHSGGEANQTVKFSILINDTSVASKSITATEYNGSGASGSLSYKGYVQKDDVITFKFVQAETNVESSTNNDVNSTWKSAYGKITITN